MDKGDLFTLVGGFVVLLIVAVIVRPDALQVLSPAPQHPVATVTITPNATPAISPEMTPTTLPVPVTKPTPIEPSPPYRITYTSNPFTYPKIHLPEHMETFGASDIPLRENRSVTFAYMEGTGGGLTQVFSVPYEVWALNMTVTADRMPQYAMFKMVLCDAETGAVLQGAEIQFPGSMYKTVQASGPMYMIITTSNVDSFRIDLETPYRYYVAAAPAV